MTQAARRKRTEADSSYPMSLLSPRGVKRKMHNICLEKKKRRSQITSLSQRLRDVTEVELEKEQSEELSAFVHMVTEDKLDSVLANEKASTAMALREAFRYDQKHNSKF